MGLRESLEKVDLFSDLPSDVIDELITRGSTRRVPPDTPLVAQGHHDSGLQLLLDGSAQVSIDGTEVSHLTEGDYFGEMSLIDGAPHAATVVSGPEGATTFAVSPATFTELLDRFPHTDRILLKCLTKRIRYLDEQLY